MTINYPKQAKELIQLLDEDQEKKREVGRLYFESKDKTSLKSKQAELLKSSRLQSKRMLEILDEIGEPSLSNIGADGAQAMSVLALHGSLNTMKQVLATFNDCYRRNRDDAYYQAIPSLTDCILNLERKPQRFGTQWLFDENKEPYMPPIEDFDHVNERRAEYGIEPFRWPKSMAIPEDKQPWLKRPLSELVMREPTDEEYNDFAKDIID